MGPQVPALSLSRWVSMDKSLSVLILSVFVCKMGINEGLPASTDGLGAW